MNSTTPVVLSGLTRAKTPKDEFLIYFLLRNRMVCFVLNVYVCCLQVKKNDYPQLEFLLNTEVAEEEFKRADKNSEWLHPSCLYTLPASYQTAMALHHA
jgi:hypothetical protein